MKTTCRRLASMSFPSCVTICRVKSLSTQYIHVKTNSKTNAVHKPLPNQGLYKQGTLEHRSIPSAFTHPSQTARAPYRMRPSIHQAHLASPPSQTPHSHRTAFLYTHPVLILTSCSRTPPVPVAPTEAIRDKQGPSIKQT
jgi:hypothetical protein